MNVDYVAAARGADLVATAVAVRRGRSLCFCEVTVADAEGAVIAKGLAGAPVRLTKDGRRYIVTYRR